MLRCEFVDQSNAHAFDTIAVDPVEIAATAAADRELVNLAGGAGTVDAAGLGTLLANIDAAFDRRWRSISPAPPRR